LHAGLIGRIKFSIAFQGFLVGVGTALLQFLTAFLVVGWFWSIM
jgi:hypothetical protein